MKTQTINTYQFDELSPKAKEKARDWFRVGLEFDAECMIDDAKTCLAFLGFQISNVYYSGFSRQGDGACFEGEWRADKVTADKLKEHAPTDTELHALADRFAALAKQIPFASFTVKHSGQAYHKFCTQFDFEYDSELSDFEKEAMEAARDCMQWIYRQLEKEYEYQNANEQIDECIRCNEYEFTEAGSRTVIL